MAHSASLDSRISVDPYSCSLDSRISVQEYRITSTPLEPDEYTSTPQPVLDGHSASSTPAPMRFKRVPRRVSSKRLEFLTSDHQLHHDVLKKCCQSECLSKIGKRGLQAIRHVYFSLNGEEQDTFIADRLQLISDGGSRTSVSFEYYLTVNDRCCRKAFKIALGIGNLRLNRIHCRCLSGDAFFEDPYVEISGKGLVGKHAVIWMQNYFRMHCEVMPTTGRLHLPDNYTRDELYQIYKDEMDSQVERYVSYSQFTRLWKMKFDNVLIPRKVRMGVCAICANLKSMIKGAKSDDVKKDCYRRSLTEHRDSQAKERMKAMHHRNKSLKFPGRYMCLMIDGMDQKKTCLPHFARLPKDIGEECLVQMHLVGCLSYHEVVKPWIYLTYPNVHNDPNLTITIIHRVLQSWVGPLPPTLYVQLDNTARENKNSSVFGYLSMLVHNGLFKKVKVNFLLVGHTHDHIDQMFSTFSKKLSRYDAFTLPALSGLISRAYTPKPEVVHLKEIYDFKRYSLADNLKIFSQLHNISFNHVFLIKHVLTEGVTLLYAKQYSTSSQWEPNSGCRFLLQMPASLNMLGAEQMPYEERKLVPMHCDNLEQQRQLWIRSLEEKKKHIENAKKYAGAQDVSWWDEYFLDQQNIIDCRLQNHWPITVPFSWTLGINSPTFCSHQLPDELRLLAQPQQRDIYVGPRMSREKESRWHGSLQEINVGSLVATLADNDDLGHPFWIAKVIELIKDESQTVLLSLKVHWYHTTNLNAFAGKYTLEMMTTNVGLGGKRRKKTVRRISTLHLEEVDVILYDFSLTKSGHLRKSTIAMIKEKLGATTTMRQTRSKSHIPEDVGLHVDEDNALINSSDEDESSLMGSSDTSGSKANE